MFDGVALAAAIAFLLGKASLRKHHGGQAMKLDDLVTASQLYVAVMTIRKTSTVPIIPVVGAKADST